MKNWLNNSNLIKRLAILIIGTTVLVIGMILLFIPGPGIPTIFFGIIILAIEFVWARRLLKKIKGQSKRLRSSLKFK